MKYAHARTRKKQLQEATLGLWAFCADYPAAFQFLVRPGGRRMSVNPFISLIEKVVATWVQVFVAGLLAADALGANVAEAAAIAAIPAALTVVANGLPAIPVGLPFYADLGLRTIRTYVAAFLGFVIAVPVFTLDYSIAVAASAAAIPAALAVVKAGLASRIGDPTSAALLPVSLDSGQGAAV